MKKSIVVPMNSKMKHSPIYYTPARSNSSCLIKKQESDLQLKYLVARQLNTVESPSVSKELAVISTLEQSRSDSNSLLPPQEKRFVGRKTLVLDLDETLVHSFFQQNDAVDITLELQVEGNPRNIFVSKRPWLDNFMQRVCELYEVIIFTASLENYANPLIDILDKKNVVAGRLFREHCSMFGGSYVKDLGRLNRDLKNVIIVSNSKRRRKILE